MKALKGHRSKTGTMVLESHARAAIIPPLRPTKPGSPVGCVKGSAEMIIGIASGIGNSDKKNLAVGLSKALGRPVRYVDCDVESNDPPVLVSNFERCDPVEVPLPAVNGWACTGGGDCAEACVPQAIGIFAGMPLVFAELCNACGACVSVCVPKAIRLKPARVGEVRLGTNGAIQHVQGRAIPGARRPQDVVEAATSFLKNATTAVLDCPPGTSQASLAAMRACDFAVILVDATPSGLHDLAQIHKAAKGIDCPVGVVLRSNDKEQKGAEAAQSYCEKNKIPLLMRLQPGGEQSEAALRAMFEAIEQLLAA